MLDQRGADARAAARDENGAALEAGVIGEIGHDSSQIDYLKQNLTRQCGAGVNTGAAYLAVGVAYGFDAEEWPTGRGEDNGMAERFAGHELQPQLARWPGHGGAPIPAIEAIVER